ncbi:MAG TPA: dihydrofolate reductase family protein [Sphingobacteriaceae bacterium]
MRKIIAAINTTLDGFCDHTLVSPDEEVHRHYQKLLESAGVILYGRITYELMKFWQPLAQNPSGEKVMDDFAAVIDRIPKIVFSNTLKDTGWESAELSGKPLRESVEELRAQPGKDVCIGCRSLMVQLTNLRLIDEYQICIHPVVAGKGLPLFDKLNERTELKLLKSKPFSSGAVIHYYQPA